MAEKNKGTLMLLKVDLECPKCYKKVKKILCKFPQIQDQMYDEKNNTVMIKVVCCSPEKIRDKICCKGRGTIKSIEILKPPEKPPPKPAEKPPPKPAEKPPAPAPKPAEKPPAPAPAPAPAPKPAEKPPAPKPAEKPPAPKPAEKPPAPKPAEKPPAPKPAEKPPAPAPAPAPVPAPAPAPAPAPWPVPIGFCCTECSEGRGGGPCYGQPVRHYDGYCGRPVYDSWGGGGYRGNYGSRCTEYYFNEDNSQGCTIM